MMMTGEHPLSLFEADSLEAIFLLAQAAQISKRTRKIVHQ
jgi:hypothetical protein